MDIIHRVMPTILSAFKSMCEILESGCSIIDIEKRVHEAGHQISRELFTSLLADIDRALVEARNKAEWEVVGFRDRTVVTLFGEVTIRRRLYRNTKEKGEYRILLDEALGLEPQMRMTPGVKELAVKLSTEMPFRKVAETLGYLAPGVSAMAAWKACEEAGRLAAEEASESRKAVFEYGEIPQGQRRPERLNIESDEVLVKAQRSSSRHVGVKLAVAYEGKERVGKDRYALKNRKVVSGNLNGEEFWEETAAQLGQEWDLGGIPQIHIGGDGADWIKEGVKQFPNARYHLDPFHLRKKLTEALGFSELHYQGVVQGIEHLDWDETAKALDQAAKAARSKAARDRVKELKVYLANNWEGIEELPEDQRLGAIEGQVRHHAARRMKRNGARWTPNGADRMARLLAAEANGELNKYTQAGRIKETTVVELAKTVEAVRKRARVEDPSEWLKVRMPVLYGPDQAKPWVQWLRGISTAWLKAM